MSKPVAFVIGYGARVGKAVAQKFHENGYAVAVASRSITKDTTSEGFYSLSVDCSQPSTMAETFAKVRKTVGIPSVVVYNAVSLTPPEDGSLLGLSLSGLQRDMNVNTFTAYTAAQEAAKGFADLPKEVSKAFIYTGNIQNVMGLPVPFLLSMGFGKAASAYWLSSLDLAYKEKGWRFYYSDQRTADGGPMGNDPEADAHANFFYKLAKEPTKYPSLATFTREGYVKFPVN